MLDYYGSIKMSKDEIKNNIVLTSNYKNYSREYLYNILDYLYMKKLLQNEYSYSGWNVFHKQDVMKNMDNYIKLDTLNCKKKLALMLQLTNSTDINYLSSASERLRVYPTPSSTKVYLLGENKLVNVFDIMGQKVYSNTQVRSIDISNWKEGVYFFSSGKDVVKIIKQ